MLWVNPRWGMQVKGVNAVAGDPTRGFQHVGGQPHLLECARGAQQAGSQRGARAQHHASRACKLPPGKSQPPFHDHILFTLRGVIWCWRLFTEATQ